MCNSAHLIYPENTDFVAKSSREPASREFIIEHLQKTIDAEACKKDARKNITTFLFYSLILLILGFTGISTIGLLPWAIDSKDLLLIVMLILMIPTSIFYFFPIAIGCVIGVLDYSYCMNDPVRGCYRLLLKRGKLYEGYITSVTRLQNSDEALIIYRIEKSDNDHNTPIELQCATPISHEINNGDRILCLYFDDQLNCLL